MNLFRRGPKIRHNSWPISSAVREGLMNFATGRFRTLAIVGLSAGLATSVVVTEGTVVSAIVDDQRAFFAAGGNVIIARGNIDPRACQSLTALTEVLGATASTRLATPIDLNVLGERSTLSLYTVGVTSLAPLLDGQWPLGREVVASKADARDRDFMVSRRLALARDVGDAPFLTISGVADFSRLGTEFDAGVAQLVPTLDTAEQCIVESTPQTVSILERALPALVTHGSEVIEVRRRVPSSRFGRDHPEDYRRRPTRLSWLPAGAAVGLMWIAVLATRRAERGLYASLGAPSVTITLVYLVEYLAQLTAGLLVAVVAAFVWADIVELERSSLRFYGLRPGILVFCVAFALGSLATVIGPRVSVAELVKDR